MEIGLAKDGSGVGGEHLMTWSHVSIGCTNGTCEAALCALQAIKQEQIGLHPETTPSYDDQRVDVHI